MLKCRLRLATCCSNSSALVWLSRPAVTSVPDELGDGDSGADRAEDGERLRPSNGSGVEGRGSFRTEASDEDPIDRAHPGNSGSPLVNIRGEVIGIITAIASRTGGFQGTGFAIPSNQAKFVYAALKEKGKVTRGWLGVSIRDVAQDAAGIQQTFQYSGTDGVFVHDLLDNAPVAGKLERGDIITEMNGKPVESVQALRNQIAETAPGGRPVTPLTLNVERLVAGTTITCGANGGWPSGSSRIVTLAAVAFGLPMRMVSLKNVLAAPSARYHRR